MRGVVFTSRNKDNILFDFEPRKKSFLSDKSVDELMDSFLEFTHQGMRGELSRFYININERDNAKTITALEHYLLDHPDFSLTKLKQKSVSLAMKPENAIGDAYVKTLSKLKKHKDLYNLEVYVTPMETIAKWQTTKGNQKLIVKSE